MSEGKISQFEDIPESYQEYVEAIYRLSLKAKTNKIKSVSNIAIAESLGIKPSSVTNMLRKLKNHGLINWQPRQRDISLTKLGVKIGKKLVYNHLLMESFLANTLGLDDEKMVHKMACELEHHMREPIFNAFKRLIGKKAMKHIESELESGKDPETIDLSKFSILPSAYDLITDFSQKLIKIMPDREETILKEKDDYLSDF